MVKDTIVNGFQNAPHRSLYHALGLTNEEQQRPMIGIVSSYNEIVPGHMNIDKIVEAVKLGVAMAGGTPIVFPAIAVCDGIAMGHTGMKYSLVALCSQAGLTAKRQVFQVCLRLSAHIRQVRLTKNSFACARKTPVRPAAHARVCTPQTQ